LRDKRTLEKKTAAPAGPRNGGEKLNRKLTKTPAFNNRTAPFPLTSLRLVGCFDDEGYLFGWEVAR
jgi:hypothetical protein